MQAHDRVRHPWVLGAALVLITAALVIALAVSEWSGTGAANVGDAGDAPLAAAPTPAAEPGRAATPEPEPEPVPARDCEATQSNPGGTNNYIPDAPFADSLGSGFVITGLVRSAQGCRPLEDVRVQVWLATETGTEQDNRASVRTGADGRYRIETDKTIAQFGEPNIHIGYDAGRYREVFIRRVIDLDDRRAVVDLTLERGG